MASYRRTAECLGFFMRGALARFSPLVQRFGISPYLDGIDPFRIHRVGGDGDVNAPIELAGTRDEATESGDVAVPILGIHEFVAGNDDQGPPQGGRGSMREVSLEAGGHPASWCNRAARSRDRR